MKNKKYNGGPLLPMISPQESIGLKPGVVKPYNPTAFQLDADTMIADFQQRNPLDLSKSYSRAPITENYTPKSKSTVPRFREKSYGGLTKGENSLIKELQKILKHKEKDVFQKEYSMGGQVLSTLAGLVPGIGGILSPAVSLIDQQIDKDNQKPMVPPETMNLNTNIYGNQMAEGGLVTKNFKQYNTGSHASGNDTPINQDGVPSANATASIQNKENAYSTKLGETYVYSDVLSNPETGNKFNIDAAKLNKKFNKADTSIEDKNALEFGMKRLSLLNDKVRSIKEAVEMACGGKVKKMAYGGEPDPVIPPSDNIMYDAKLNDLYLDTELSIPPSDNIMFDAKLSDLYEPTTPLEVMAGRVYDTTNLPAYRSNNRSLPNLNSLIKPTEAFTPKTSNTKSEEFNYNVPALILKGAGLAKSAVDALTPPEIESTILPDYRKSDEQMYSTNIDYTQAKQDALAAANLAGNVNRSASGSFEQMQGRQANNYANYADAVGRISMKEALDRNQQYVQRAGYEQGKAVDTANRNTQNRINNQQNAAVADLADQKFFSEITSIGSEFNQYAETQKEIANNKELQRFYVNQGLALVNSKYSNFQLAPDLLERLKSDTYTIDDIVKVKMVVDKQPKK